ncbi:hypothetical protein ACFV4F_34370 [Kitasatospora sp. NPDC059722]|uniref:hypothetical protein n=1 Tax=Kitasatospora sp. NPDC059722 TaxID=3346925 RepID=UPI0036CCA45F
MSIRIRKTLAATAFGVFMTVIAASTLALSTATAAVPSPIAPSDPNLPPSAVEDFTYPGAAEIQQERGIKLIKGNGRLLLSECNSAVQQVKVYSTNGDVCFQAVGAGGYLTMEITKVFAFEASDRPISANLTAGGATQTVSVAQGGYKSVGEGTVGGIRSTLVELRITG